jgi:alkaline phosphatase D
VRPPDRLSRRAFLALGATVVVGACSAGDDAAPTSTPAPDATSAADTTVAPATPAATTRPSTPPTTTSTTPPTTAVRLPADPFLLGVTCGDPDATSVVLWTRLVGALPAVVDVAWELAADDSFDTIVDSGTTTATAAHGHCVHVVADVGGPVAYRFRAGGFTSPTGRAAPATGRPALKLATATCQHWETGFYAAHRDLVAWAPDVVVFLGDFIYEGASRPVGEDRVRSHDGPEASDLEGYRARYAQYLSDPDLQASRAACPWFVVWDDHEVENNYAGLVPQDPVDQATFAGRRLAAYEAWWEHMPVRIERPRDGAETVIHRRARFGDLLDLVLLDGRQFRSDQACGGAELSTEPACPDALDPARTMLGAGQEAWVTEALGASRAAWAAIGQQTVVTDLRLPNGGILNYDQWDGYAPARDRLLAAAAPVAGRTVVLTGDIHLAGVGVLPGIGTEFVTTSVSSSGDIPPALQPVLASFDHIVDAELVHRGYVRHTVTPSTWTADYRIVDDVTDPASATTTWRTFSVAAGASDVVAVG